MCVKIIHGTRLDALYALPAVGDCLEPGTADARDHGIGGGVAASYFTPPGSLVELH